LTLEKLREKISKQEEVDQKEEIAGKLDNMQPSGSQMKNQGEFQLMRMIEKMDTSKGVNSDPVYEQLGFKHNLKFGARSELRDACKKFLRFAFLLDFIALESLSSICLLSIHGCIEKLKLQVRSSISYELVSARANFQPQKPPAGRDGKPSKKDEKSPREEAALGGYQ
jgi:hypothetical protein